MKLKVSDSKVDWNVSSGYKFLITGKINFNLTNQLNRIYIFYI